MRRKSEPTMVHYCWLSPQNKNDVILTHDNLPLPSQFQSTSGRDFQFQKTQTLITQLPESCRSSACQLLITYGSTPSMPPENRRQPLVLADASNKSSWFATKCHPKQFFFTSDRQLFFNCTVSLKCFQPM